MATIVAVLLVVTVRHPTKLCKRSHVKELIFHAFPKDEKRKQHWISQVSKGQANFKWGKQVRICSNHVVDGKPTTENSFPTLFLCERDLNYLSSKKRARVESSRNRVINDSQSIFRTLARKGYSDKFEHRIAIQLSRKRK